jgi:hypothetical protein
MRGSEAEWHLASAEAPVRGRRWSAPAAEGSRILAVSDETEFRIDVPCR